MAADLKESRRLLALAKPFIENVLHDAEVAHDTPESGYYLDLHVYETIKDAQALLADIKRFMEWKA